LTQALATLPPVQPNEARADQVRTECRTLLERSQRHSPLPVEPAAIGTFCAVYVWQIVRIVVR
jgi:hypothetical protein